MKMKKLSEYLFMGALGGTLYYMIEISFQRIFSLVDAFCWAESVLYFSHNKGYGRSGESLSGNKSFGVRRL